jgi:hypothetical protein
MISAYPRKKRFAIILLTIIGILIAVSALLFYTVFANQESAVEKEGQEINEETNQEADEQTYSTDVPVPLIADFKISVVSQLTGAEITEETYDVTGTDLGSMFEMDGKMYYVFGDTFGFGSKFPPNKGPTTNWRSNVIAFSTDMNPEDGIELEGFLQDAYGQAKELIPAKKIRGDHLTSIPTYGVAVNGKMYLYYMAVDRWGQHGFWDTAFSSVYVSEDKGENWSRIEELTWGSDSNFTQVAIVKPDQNKEVLGEDIYFYGAPLSSAWHVLCPCEAYSFACREP